MGRPCQATPYYLLKYNFLYWDFLWSSGNYWTISEFCCSCVLQVCFFWIMKFIVLFGVFQLATKSFIFSPVLFSLCSSKDHSLKRLNGDFCDFLYNSVFYFTSVQLLQLQGKPVTLLILSTELHLCCFCCKKTQTWVVQSNTCNI